MPALSFFPRQADSLNNNQQGLRKSPSPRSYPGRKLPKELLIRGAFSLLPAFLSGTCEPLQAAEPPNAGFETPTPAELIASQVPSAKERIEKYHADSLGNSNRTLHIVYWTPADRVPSPGYQERLTRVLSHVQEFYAREMNRLGFGRATFGLERDEAGLVKIHLVQGSGNYDQYDVQSGSAIRRESLPILSKAGIDAQQETIVIFCNMSNWDPVTGNISQNSPYYAGGGLHGGTAWQVDSPILDSDKLAEKIPIVSDRQYGKISIGKYNSIFVGGVCHELGHALGLPHNREREDEATAFGTALMGSGDRTYGEELRSEGRGSFLTLGEGLRLAAHPLFTKSDKGRLAPRTSSIGDLKIELSPNKKSFRVSGKVSSTPACYAIVAYMDPAGGSDYDATTMTAIPEADGSFSLPCTALRSGTAGELRLVVCTVGGGNIGDKTLAVPYQVATDGTVDLFQFLATTQLAPVAKAINAREIASANKLVAELKSQKADSRVLEIAESLLDSATPPKVDPLDYKARKAFLSDLKPEKEVLGYGRPIYNRQPEEPGVLAAGGEIFAKGIYAHAPSEHIYALGKKWKSFAGQVAIADGRGGSCIFVIAGDGHELWRSKKIEAGKTVPFEVSVAGVTSLSLIVDDAGDGKASDWGLWLDPTLTKL